MLKQLLAKFGYREWEFVEFELKPGVTLWTYRCRITGKTLVIADMYS